jgi:hypothetical protein
VWTDGVEEPVLAEQGLAHGSDQDNLSFDGSVIIPGSCSVMAWRS